MQLDNSGKHILDSIIGLGAVSWPLWAQLLQMTGYVITFLGGVILLGLRIVIAWRELFPAHFKSKRKD